jgi:thiol-disulfide isomerase/thioredoxin
MSLEFVVRLLMLAILLSVPIAGCGKTNEGDKRDAPRRQESAALPGTFDRSEAGTAIPALAFEAPDGRRVRLDALDRPLLVNLWATWCAPCVAELPALDRLAESRAGELQVVAVSQDLQGWTMVRPFLAKAKLAHLFVLLDSTGAFATAVAAPGLPMTILYDASGREVWRVNGPREWDRPGGFRND